MAVWRAAICRLRDEATLRQKDIAKRLYRSPTAVSNWFNGKQIPEPSDAEKLLQLFALTDEERESVWSLYLGALRERQPDRARITELEDEARKLRQALAAEKAQNEAQTSRVERLESTIAHLKAELARKTRETRGARAAEQAMTENLARVSEERERLHQRLAEGESRVRVITEELARLQAARTAQLQAEKRVQEEAAFWRDQCERLREELAAARSVLAQYRARENAEAVVAEALRVVDEAERAHQPRRVVFGAARTPGRIVQARLRAVASASGLVARFFLPVLTLYGLLLAAAAGIGLVCLAPLLLSSSSAWVSLGWWSIGLGVGGAVAICSLSFLISREFGLIYSGMLGTAAVATGAMGLAAVLLSLAGYLWLPKMETTQPVTAVLSNCHNATSANDNHAVECTYTWRFQGKQYSQKADAEPRKPYVTIKINSHDPSISNLHDPHGLDIIVPPVLALTGAASMWSGLRRSRDLLRSEWAERAILRAAPALSTAG